VTISSARVAVGRHLARGLSKATLPKLPVRSVDIHTWFALNNYMSIIRRSVIISQSTFQNISNCIAKVNNSYEVGGVLLGHRHLRTYFIIDATIPFSQKVKSNISFELDGVKETQLANRLISMYRKKPSLVGIWHSHVGRMDTFSSQDKHSNQKFAEIVGGAISAIAIPTSDARLDELVSYYISPKGKEALCFTVVDTQKYIPRQYLIKNFETQ